MPISSVEERLTAIEAELAQIKQLLATNKHPHPIHPWEKVFGSFANSEGFEEAVRLGREYRESFRPPNEEEN